MKATVNGFRRWRVRKQAARPLGGTAALTARGLSKGWKLREWGNLLNGREEWEWESLGFNTETESMAKLIMVKEVRRREGGVEGRRRLRERKRRRIYSGEKNGNGKWRGEEVFVKCPKPNHPKDAKGKIEECVGWGVCLFAARTRIGGERVTPITYYSSTSNTMLCSVGPRIPQVQAIANSSFSFCHLLFLPFFYRLK